MFIYRYNPARSVWFRSSIYLVGAFFEQASNPSIKTALALPWLASYKHKDNVSARTVVRGVTHCIRYGTTTYCGCLSSLATIARGYLRCVY
mmetsp:Transcript_2947/g.6313  ORF Transcript_2947/g.6313 Transcript_2947/m.6313 type:complete len:91 (-) Transcript_2947:47-319(-)